VLRQLLADAGAYRAFARGIGATRARRRYADRFIRAKPGDRVLDLGCGPADILDVLHEVSYCGVDMSSKYIRAARERFGDRGDFQVRTLDESTVTSYKGFDLVLATGLLHHLNDEEALGLFRTANAALKPGGTLVTLDGCFTCDQSRVVKWLLRQDRGRFVRPVEEYKRLAGIVFGTVESHVVDDLLRIPYTHLIMRCTNLRA
jgi:SAM-dependent methyltransferase